MAEKQQSVPGRSRTAEILAESYAISDEDIYEAMKEIPGYIDITTSDFKELYHLSFRHAAERLTRSICARDIMSRDVVTVNVTTSLYEVATRMASAGISGVPVLAEDEKLAGMITKRDFLKHMGAEKGSFMSVVASCLKGKGCAAIGIRKGQAGDIMSQPVISVPEEALLVEVAAILTKHNINRVPVLSAESDRIVGFLTRSDLVQAHVLK